MKHDLSSYQAVALANLMQDIIKEISPEKIFLLAVCRYKQFSENIFVSQSIELEKTCQFDLLILAGEDEQRSSDSIQDIIENKCGAGCSTTAFVLPIHQFNTWLMHSQPFACKVYHTAKLCYDAGRIPLAIPDRYDPEEVQNNLHGKFSQKVRLATEFLSGAELFTVRKQFPLAAFHLHQAAEQLYAGIIQVITGLRVHTHNLDKLYRYSRYLLAGLEDVFPCNSETEKRLFKLLQKAYIESRYEIEYSIKQEEIKLLNDRIIKLLQLCLPIKNLTRTFI